MRLMSRLLVSIALLCIAMSTVGATTRDRADLNWQTFQVPEYGTHLEYPAAIFAPVGEAEKGVGQRLREKTDRRSCLSTPASMRTRAHLLGLDYERSPAFFAISMERDGTIFYSRCNFSARRSIIHCFDLVYPQKRKKGLGPCGNTPRSLAAPA